MYEEACSNPFLLAYFSTVIFNTYHEVLKYVMILKLYVLRFQFKMLM